MSRLAATRHARMDDATGRAHSRRPISHLCTRIRTRSRSAPGTKGAVTKAANPAGPGPQQKEGREGDRFGAGGRGVRPPTCLALHIVLGCAAATSQDQQSIKRQASGGNRQGTGRPAARQLCCVHEFSGAFTIINPLREATTINGPVGERSLVL
ncbi:hypothetical protein B0I35DRAFT_187047 [Stachybotrys elegans]|uniref:Uncharacterized protein n=1 Tax=Stachybotrys elegans TaxID=80388 RepID=A0A8K0T119_9HYPO|nr:hypothetical protein B0I35DRAFT_187047 [Stachybotrys elegans]